MDLNSPKKRILAGLVILGLIVTLCVYYSIYYEDYLEYPSYGAILSDYPEGMLVQVDGTVVKTVPGGYEIEQIYQDQVVTINVNSGTEVEVGDRVNLVGELDPGYTVVNIRKVYVNQWWKYQFVLLRSLLVLVLMVFLFYRYWTFDPKKLVFRRR